jgi:putative membrane protein
VAVPPAAWIDEPAPDAGRAFSVAHSGADSDSNATPDGVMLASNMDRRYRYPLALLAAFAAIFIALAIAPRYPQDWLLENVIVFVAVPLFALNCRRLRFSDLAYSCLFVFLALHEIGAHYTYSEVPWRDWLAVFGHETNSAPGRNHYDRFVHFCYGLLMLPIAWELFAARASPRGLWRWLMPLLFVISHSVIYELVEWLAAALFGGDLGMAYLGTQGDVWDAQKDMALATAGAVIGTIVMLILRGHPRRASGPIT